MILRTIYFVLAVFAATSLQAACLQVNDAARLDCYDRETGYSKPETQPTKSMLDENDFRRFLSSDSTEATRESDFEGLEGSRVSFTGSVLSVDTPGWLSKDYRVHLSYRGVSGFCNVDPIDKAIVARLREGEEFTCEGRFKRFSYILGSGSVSIHLTE